MVPLSLSPSSETEIPSPLGFSSRHARRAKRRTKPKGIKFKKMDDVGLVCQLYIGSLYVKEIVGYNK